MTAAPKSISSEEVDWLYSRLEQAHKTHLEQFGVTLPGLKRSGKYTKNAVVLAVLLKYFRQSVSKIELSGVIARFFQEPVADVQQARHLGKQTGWYILSGTRGQVAPADLRFTLNNGDYCLYSVSEPYPGREARKGHHRQGADTVNLVELKRIYDNRCASCGSEEAQPNLRDRSRITRLQIGHMDPRRGLSPGNVIPQCSECNQAYRDWFVFDGNGRVTDINHVSDHWQGVYKKVGDVS